MFLLLVRAPLLFRDAVGGYHHLRGCLHDNTITLCPQLVPAVTELMVAELLYLEKQGNSLPIEMLINSSGTTRQDGEILAFDSEGIALTSTMGFIKNPISTVNMGLAVGWSAVVLSFGKKGWRKSLPHSLAMIQQPRVPPTGAQRLPGCHILLDDCRHSGTPFACASIQRSCTGLPIGRVVAILSLPSFRTSWMSFFRHLGHN